MKAGLKRLKALADSVFFGIRVRSDVLPRDPWGKKPLASRAAYQDLFDRFKNRQNSELDALERELGYAVDIGWLNELAFATQVTKKTSDLNWDHGRLLYSTARDRLEKLDAGEPVCFFETGTARGFSSVVMARALIDSQSQGFVLTLDALPHNHPQIWNAASDTTDGPQSRAELLGKWSEETGRIIFLQGWSGRTLPRIGLGRIHMAFIDGSHTKTDVLKEFRFVEHRQQAGDLVVFDDVTPHQFPGIVSALKEIENEFPYEITRYSGNALRGYGVARRLEPN